MLTAEFAEYLDLEGVGTYDATGATGDIFVETLPESPDECIALYTRSGPASSGPSQMDIRGLQVLVRGTQDPRGAGERAQSIYDLLHNLHASTVGNTYVYNCLGTQGGPVHIGRDANGRHEYSINFEIAIQNTERRT
jgi:hypothetical protein